MSLRSDPTGPYKNGKSARELQEMQILQTIENGRRGNAGSATQTSATTAGSTTSNISTLITRARKLIERSWTTHEDLSFGFSIVNAVEATCQANAMAHGERHRLKAVTDADDFCRRILFAICYAAGDLGPSGSGPRKDLAYLRDKCQLLNREAPRSAGSRSYNVFAPTRMQVIGWFEAAYNLARRRNFMELSSPPALAPTPIPSPVATTPAAPEFEKTLDGISDLIRRGKVTATQSTDTARGTGNLTVTLTVNQWMLSDAELGMLNRYLARGK